MNSIEMVGNVLTVILDIIFVEIRHVLSIVHQDLLQKKREEIIINPGSPLQRVLNLRLHGNM